LEELKGLKSKLADDKTAREVITPALLLMQEERLGVDETPLKNTSSQQFLAQYAETDTCLRRWGKSAWPAASAPPPCSGRSP
jgi:hypothetical protein